jgi:hypothetical protein
MDEKKLLGELDKAGIPYQIIEVKITPELKRMERDVCKFVMEIEKAHKKAAKSKLRFDFEVKAPSQSVLFTFDKLFNNNYYSISVLFITSYIKTFNID